jgi:hypothetical protein
MTWAQANPELWNRFELAPDGRRSIEIYRMLEAAIEQAQVLLRRQPTPGRNGDAGPGIPGDRSGMRSRRCCGRRDSRSMRTDQHLPAGGQ